MADSAESGRSGVPGGKSNLSAFYPCRSRSSDMSGLQCLAAESVWFDKRRYDEAEKCFYEGANGPAPQQQQVGKSKS